MRRNKRRKLTGPIHGRITRLREAKGLSKVALAAKVGVHKTAVGHWEAGYSRPDVSRLSKVASALDVTVDDLIRGEKAA